MDYVEVRVLAHAEGAVTVLTLKAGSDVGIVVGAKIRAACRDEVGAIDQVYAIRSRATFPGRGVDLRLPVRIGLGDATPAPFCPDVRE